MIENGQFIQEKSRARGRTRREYTIYIYIKQDKYGNGCRHNAAEVNFL